MPQTRLHGRPMDSNLIEIRGLVAEFRTEAGPVRALNGINMAIPRGRTLAVLGESGCGKSVTAQCILNLVRHPGRITAGTIHYSGGTAPMDIATLSPTSETMRRIRGAEIAMIFQEPMTSFDPLFTVGDQIVEMLQAHDRKLPKTEARARAIAMLGRVRLPSPELIVDRYPHQLSGGMRQRVMIALALSCDPKLLIADEPTTALDVTTESQILDLLRELQAQMGMSIMFITHDLGVASEMADEVIVMYLGYVVEQGPAGQVLTDPHHPYTRALMESVPKLGAAAGGRLNAIKGMVPTPDQMPPGCPFHTRCTAFIPGRCDRVLPDLWPAGDGRLSRCHLSAPGAAT